MIAGLNKGRIGEYPVHGWRKIPKNFLAGLRRHRCYARPRQSTLISHVPKDSGLVLTPRSIIRSLIRSSRWYNICCNFIRTSFHYPCPMRTIHLRFSVRSCVSTYRFILEFLRSIRSYSRQGDRHVSRVCVRIPIRFAKLAPKRATRIAYVSVIIKWRTRRIERLTLPFDRRRDSKMIHFRTIKEK